MTEEIKKRLEQAAHKWYGNTPGDRSKNIFKHGVQTILENPGKWGLADMDEITQAHLRYFKAVREATKYREALERIIVEALERVIVEAEDNEQVDWMYIAENMVEIAKEALKHEVNNG